MALIDMKNVTNDYHLGETVVHALREIDLEGNPSPSGTPQAPAKLPFSASPTPSTSQPGKPARWDDGSWYDEWRAALRRLARRTSIYAMNEQTMEI
jgi:hypothetical protein